MKNKNIGFYRLHHILGDKKRNLEPLIPVSKTYWWDGIKDGKFPRPYKFDGMCFWKKEDIFNLIEQIENE